MQFTRRVASWTTYQPEKPAQKSSLPDFAYSGNEWVSSHSWWVVVVHKVYKPSLTSHGLSTHCVWCSVYWGEWESPCPGTTGERWVHRSKASISIDPRVLWEHRQGPTAAQKVREGLLWATWGFHMEKRVKPLLISCRIEQDLPSSLRDGCNDLFVNPFITNSIIAGNEAFKINNPRTEGIFSDAQHLWRKCHQVFISHDTFRTPFCKRGFC